METVFRIGLVIGMFVCGRLCADVRMPSVFSDNMVLQRDRPVTVRGWAEPSEKVTVEFAGQRVGTVADQTGKWSLVLKPLRQSAEAQEMRVAGKNTLVIKNVLVGDVWLASGQSNMEMRLKQAADAAAEIKAADYPSIRFFMVKTEVAPTPKEDCEGEWRICAPDKAGRSRRRLLLARELHQKYGSRWDHQQRGRREPVPGLDARRGAARRQEPAQPADLHPRITRT
jgi:sialate O-acetylesterase